MTKEQAQAQIRDIFTGAKNKPRKVSRNKKVEPVHYMNPFNYLESTRMFSRIHKGSPVTPSSRDIQGKSATGPGGINVPCF